MDDRRSTDITNTVDRIIRERLEQFNVPLETRQEIRREVLAFLQRPEKKPHGATVMTPEASMASDQARKDKRVQDGGPTPQVI